MRALRDARRLLAKYPDAVGCLVILAWLALLLFFWTITNVLHIPA